MSKEKLILHICCGPCAIYPLQKISKKFEVKGYFYNPNIFPLKEVSLRKKNLKKASSLLSFEVFYEEGNHDDFLNEIKGKENNLRKKRCKACYTLRLKKTVLKAKKEGINNFSTSLLVSPYQDIYAIKEIGEKIAKKEGMHFYFEDLRKGFMEGRKKAKEMNLYLQNYCGCEFSLKEKRKKK